MIYMDYAATTPMYPEVLEVMLPYFNSMFYNPSGAYGSSQAVRKKVEQAREIIAQGLRCHPQEIFFTSGGTEGDNWIVRGMGKQAKRQGRCILTSTIEHHGILNICKVLEQEGVRVQYVPVDEEGRIRMTILKQYLEENVAFVSVMYANNEIGTIEPINQIARWTHEAGAYFHTDAVQGCGHLPIFVKEQQIDSLSASAHKFGGPKGVGFLYLDKRIKLEPLIFGGGQERGIRAGTENVPGIIGMAKAFEISLSNMRQQNKYLRKLQIYMKERILREIPYCRLNGSEQYRLSNNLHFTFDYVSSNALLSILDEQGICASGGSACNSHKHKPSHVLTAIGNEEADGALRLTLGAEHTWEEADYVIETLKQAVWDLRKKSPEYEDFLAEQG